MESRSLRYFFHPVSGCNMCGAAPTRHRVLGRRLNGSQGMFPRGKVGITTTVMKCEVCGLVFSSPMPVPFDLHDHYGMTPEEYWKGVEFKVPDSYFVYTIKQFKSLVDFRPGMRALDIGAGLGKAMIAMERAGFDTHGFEASKPFRDQAIGRMGVDPGRLRLGDVDTITYEAESFDLVTFGAVLEHLYDPARSIARALGWLRPGGLIHIQVPSSDWLVARLVNCAYWIQGSDYVSNISPMHPPFHMYEFTLGSFTRNGKAQGYEMAHHEYFICETYMPRILDPLLRRIMKSTDTGMEIGVWLKKVAADSAARPT